MNIEEKMQAHLDNLTKPRGSLGRLEEFALRMARIQGGVPPVAGRKGIYVFAGDHGVAAEGVSLYPQEVTVQMAENIFHGGAGINALAGGTGFEVTLVDAGVLGGHLRATTQAACRFIDAKTMQGSRNFYREAAMTADETRDALAAGRRLADDAVAQGYVIAAIGDLGIGNTSTAAAMLVAAGFDADDVVDRGTGIDDAMLSHKHKVIVEAVRKHNPAKSGEAILAALGSPDYAMMAGFVLGLEGKGIACVLDGFPVTSAAYIAYMMNPNVAEYLFAGHLSKVSGHKKVLDKMGLSPIVNLEMRLGEGTGAVIGGNIVELAVIASAKMASFASANVSGGELLEEEKY
jgi:nicotinate-nucleotide--dimethylbenzimidazole phosphoribosyltransferase